MKLLSKLSEYGWNIAYRNTSACSIMEDRCTPFHLIPNPYRSWVADPFVFIHEGTTYIFAEVFDYLTRKGAIGYTSFVDGKWTKWETAIDENFHMSYPNVFTWDGQIYMVPETSADRTLLLYKAISFPKVWKQEKTIATNVAWVDTTFFEHRGHRYAVTTDVSNEEEHKDLLLFFDKQWNISACKTISEKQNAISRSGGNFIEGEIGTLRVTQDCRGHYGSALLFSRFSPDTVLDTGLGEILLYLKPEDLPIHTIRKWTGLHTYNSAGTLEVVDIERKHYNLLSFIGRLLWKVKLYLER